MRVRFQAGTCAPAPVARHQPLPTPTRTPTPTPSPSHGFPFRQAAVAVAVLVALVGCASSAGDKQAFAWKVEPVLDVQHGAQSSEAYYALGRYHDGSQAWDKAIDAYRKAVAADVRNVEARNALGVALARSHRFDEAEATLRKALGIDPNSAHVRSNLGFVLLLAGRPQEAVGELQTALTLDRENATARANLHDALAQSEQRQASGPAEAAPTLPSAPVVENTADQRVPTSLPVPPVASANVSVQLELSNGNGIKGAAAHLKRWLTAEGLQVGQLSLSNRRPFDQQQTVIQYRAGQQEAAMRVAQALRMMAQLGSTPSTDLRSDVRVVLGHDWARTAACLERNACERASITVVAALQR